MKFLLIRERLRRHKFKKIESQYIALKAIVHNQKIPIQVRWEASLLLAKIVKKNSPSSFKNRCFLTGRSRGYLNFFNLSRIQVLTLARNNNLSFITKASW
jgi:small subunit ribosomal protein S14